MASKSSVRLAKGLFRSAFGVFGLDVVRRANIGSAYVEEVARALPDLSTEDQDIIARARHFTMTSYERMGALVAATEYICRHRIPGNIAECGVWRGGSMMVVAQKLIACGDTSRDLYLYDTFEGMPPPTSDDKCLNGEDAAAQLARDPKGTGVWCEAGQEEVRKNIVSTGYPPDKIHLIQGKVEDTIPNTMPGPLAILRLDTDWYESTKHELLHLYPFLQEHGVLIVDDYGHWQGARKAVDEFVAAHDRPLFLHRIDYTGRLWIK